MLAQDRGRALLSSLELSTGNPTLRPTFQKWPRRGNHNQALKLCHPEILTHLAVGAVCAAPQNVSQKVKFLLLFPHVCSLHHSQGSRG